LAGFQVTINGRFWVSTEVEAHRPIESLLLMDSAGKDGGLRGKTQPLGEDNVGVMGEREGGVGQTRIHRAVHRVVVSHPWEIVQAVGLRFVDGGRAGSVSNRKFLGAFAQDRREVRTGVADRPWAPFRNRYETRGIVSPTCRFPYE